MKKEIKYAAFVLSLIIFASAAFKAQDRNNLLPTLSGEKAVENLKQNGQYDSLMEAVKTVRTDDGKTENTITENLSAQTAKLTAADGTTFDFLGGTVAISGNTAIVGATGDDIGGNSTQGSAYIFVRNGTTWTQQAKLIASDGAEGDWFGASVGISGDTAVVGGWSVDVNGNFNQGAAYVFVRSGTVWTQQQKLTAADGIPNDEFGVSAAIDGNTIIVGAYSFNTTAPNSRGSAYIFVRSGSVWTEQQKLLASDGAINDKFGNDVEIDGDTAVIGAADDDVGANTDQGAAYVFTRNGTVWSEQQKLTSSDGAAADRFGVRVAIDGETVVVGASDDDVAFTNQGSASVFVRSGSVWTEQQKLTTAEGGTDDRFGAVAISGDTIIVGAPGKDFLNFDSERGAAYLFIRNGTTWTEQQRLIASDGGQGDIFGTTVAIDGNKIIVGAQYADIGQNTGQGAAYAFVAGVSVGGRVTTQFGNGVSNALVQMTTEATGSRIFVRTSSFGYYQFDNVEADQTVTIAPISRQYQFTPQTVNVTGNLTDVNFQAQP